LSVHAKIPDPPVCLRSYSRRRDDRAGKRGRLPLAFVLQCAVFLVLAFTLATCIERYSDFGQEQQDVADSKVESKSEDTVGDVGREADVTDRGDTGPLKFRHIGWFGAGGTAADPTGVRSTGSLSSFGAGNGAR